MNPNEQNVAILEALGVPRETIDITSRATIQLRPGERPLVVLQVFGGLAQRFPGGPLLSELRFRAVPEPKR